MEEITTGDAVAWYSRRRDEIQWGVVTRRAVGRRGHELAYCQQPGLERGHWVQVRHLTLLRT